MYDMCVCTCVCCKWGEEKSVDKTIYVAGHEKLQEQYLHLNKDSKGTVERHRFPGSTSQWLAPTTEKTANWEVLLLESVGLPGERGIGLHKVAICLEY